MSGGSAARGAAAAVCNICGTALLGVTRDREAPNCPHCRSNARLRSLLALLSREMFGALIALPGFPPLKSVRGLGMSDWPIVAEILAQKFDYVNTYFDRPPKFDVTNPGEHRGRYDFILSSEVMEHVTPPVDEAFAKLASLLKPDGLLILSTPYGLEGKTIEHFPELHEFGLTRAGEKMVLVNRRRDGTVETFEDLTFHGGSGATLEMRIFSKESLERALKDAGFASVHFAVETAPEFGVEAGDEWSLPIAARKGNFRAPVDEMALRYAELVDERNRLERAVRSPWRRVARKLGMS